MSERKRPRRMQKVETVDEAIDALGGPTKVALWLETDQSAVSQMKKRGYVSRGWHLHFYFTLVDRGFNPSPRVFGLTSFKRLLMPRSRRGVQRQEHHG